MQLIINLPNREETLAQHRERWEEVLQNDVLARIPGRIETNASGQILMAPPASGSHSTRQGSLAFELRRHLGGVANPECPIITSDGVKSADVSWYSDARHAQVRGQRVFETAGEICVEIQSPRNSADELRNKRALYFEAGAIECWQCDLAGLMTYYRDQDPDTPHPQSTLCPDFPSSISD